MNVDSQMTLRFGSQICYQGVLRHGAHRIRKQGFRLLGLAKGRLKGSPTGAYSYSKSQEQQRRVLCGRARHGNKGQHPQTGLGGAGCTAG